MKTPRHIAAQFIFYGYYVSLYAPVAVTISFLPLWIKSRGLTEQQIGLLFALSAVMRLVVNPVVGYIADAYESRKGVLVALLLATSVSTMLLQNLQGALWVFGIYAATRALSTSLIPLSESIALIAVSRYRLDFGRLRGVGSMSVVVTTVVLGVVVDRHGLDFVAWALALLFVIQTAAAGMLPSLPATSSQIRKVPLAQVMRLPGFVLFLCCAASSQACHGVFYTYSVIYWKSLGLSSSVIGALWSLGVLAEIVVFMLGDRIMTRFSAATLILVGCVGGVVRWTLLAEGEHLGVMFVVQVLQAATLGFTQLGAAQFIKTTVPEQAISSGSGIYAAAVGGLTAVAVYGSSRLYAAFGGQAFALSTAMCLVGAVAATLLRRHLRNIPLAK